MNTITSTLLWLGAGVLACCLAGNALGAPPGGIALVPAPREMQPQPGVFTLGPKTQILADRTALATAQYLAER